MTDAVTVPCPMCEGCGRIELTGEYRETFEVLRAMGREANGVELAALMGVKPTAMNNRLASLERHGLVTSRRYGRRRLFKVVAK